MDATPQRLQNRNLVPVASEHRWFIYNRSCVCVCQQKSLFVGKIILAGEFFFLKLFFSFCQMFLFDFFSKIFFKFFFSIFFFQIFFFFSKFRKFVRFLLYFLRFSSPEPASILISLSLRIDEKVARFCIKKFRLIRISHFYKVGSKLELWG